MDIWKELVGLVVGAASIRLSLSQASHDHFTSRLEAAPTQSFYDNQNIPDKRSVYL